MLKAVNPATGQIVREVALDTNESVNSKIEASLKAFESWKAKSFAERANLL